MPNPFNPGASKDVSIARFFESRPGEAPWSEKASQYLWEKYGQPAIGALALPGDVYAGRVDPKSEEGIGRAFDLAGMMTLGAGAMPAEGTVNMGIKAYHGSPHDFDKFSLDKIGTGEGAQAYGHGLYFADNEAVARGYRDELAGKDRIFVDGKMSNAPAEDIWGMDGLSEKARHEAGWHLNRGWTLNDALKELDKKSPADAASLREAMQSGRLKAEHVPGKMYEVDINADPAHFLDHDAPLSQQPPKAKKYLESELRRYLGSSYDGQVGNFKDLSAGEILEQTKGRFATSPATSAEMKKAGVPGIKYLDQGSRAAGDGSRNYVVFDDKLISIARKYGWVPGMAVPPAMLLELQGGQDKPKGPEA